MVLTPVWKTGGWLRLAGVRFLLPPPWKVNLAGPNAVSKTVGLYKGCGSIPPPSANLYRLRIMENTALF